MKKILFLTLAFLLFCCKNRKINFYEGHIYDENNNPLPNIKVCKMYHTPTDCTMTDANGYFKINEDPTSMTDLIVFYKEQPIDTMRTLWTQAGERIMYSFVEGKNDTLFIDMSKYEK